MLLSRLIQLLTCSTIPLNHALYKYTCIELKTDRAVLDDLTQILKYEEWVQRRLASGDSHMVQSVLLAHSFTDEVVEYVKKRREIEERTVQLICYQFDGIKQTIELHSPGD